MRIFHLIPLMCLLLGIAIGSCRSDSPQTIEDGPMEDGPMMGALIDGPVSGVTYEAPSFRGVTDAEGRFAYEAGETIEFRIGDTVLGRVVGKDTVTPFDLIPGAEAATGGDIQTETGYGSPFSAVINLTVLLQTLDQDGDAQNGIEIAAEVAAHFENVQLRFEQKPNAFHLDPAFRSALADLNDLNLLDGIRDVRSPDVAIQHLYDVLDIDARIFAFSTSARDTNGDGIVDSRTANFFDGYGHRVRQETDSDADGTVDKISTETWNDNGQHLVNETDSNADGSIDSRSSYIYDEFGNEIRYEHDSDADGNPNSIRTSEYNRLGRPIRTERDNDADGNPESITWFSYDGNTTRAETDSDADGTIDSVTMSERDDGGNFIRFERDTDADGFANSLLVNEYNDRGNRTYRENDDDGDGTPDDSETTTYNEDGRQLRREEDVDADGTPDHVETWTYSDDRLTRRELDNDADGIPDTVTIYTYDDKANTTRAETRQSGVLTRVDVSERDANGKVIRREADTDADGTPDSIGTYTYVPVSFAWIFDF